MKGVDHHMYTVSNKYVGVHAQRRQMKAENERIYG